MVSKNDYKDYLLEAISCLDKDKEELVISGRYEKRRKFNIAMQLLLGTFNLDKILEQTKISKSYFERKIRNIINDLKNEENPTDKFQKKKMIY